VDGDKKGFGSGIVTGTLLVAVAVLELLPVTDNCVIPSNNELIVSSSLSCGCDGFVIV
jgi:hypothetical protein